MLIIDSIVIQELTLRHCLALHNCVIDFDNDEYNALLTIVLIMSDCNDISHILNTIALLEVADYSRLRTICMIAINTAREVSPEKIYQIVYNLNHRSFRGWNEYLDIPIGHLHYLSNIVSNSGSPSVDDLFGIS